MGRGLLVGSAIAAGLGLVNLAWSIFPLPSAVLSESIAGLLHRVLLPGVAVVALLVGPATGAWLAARRKTDWPAAAAAVDRHYHLDDRTITALGFLAKAEPRPLELRVIADGTERLAQLDPRKVVPAGLPKPLPAALLLLACAAAAIAAPLAMRPTARPPVEPPAEPAAAARPPGESPPPDAATPPSIAAEIGWQVAPSGEIAISRSEVLEGTLEEIVSGIDQRRTTAQAGDAKSTASSEQEAAMQVVVEGERVPRKHRRTILRYFESIAPGGRPGPDDVPAEP